MTKLAQITNDILDDARKCGDAHADDFIAQVVEKHELSQINIFFKSLVYNNQIHKPDIPTDFTDYINENSALPAWADIEKIKLAQEAFTRIGPVFVISYFCKSLPECYACGKGAEVLYKTGRLTEHTRRRVAQTAQFVLDVMSPGGLEENGRGIATSLKVRLMHASIRYYFMREVKRGRIEYDAAHYGYPINQEDLLGTMLAFSCVVIEGMEHLGFKISVNEKDAILHLWKCVGFLIGIDEKLMPHDYHSALQTWKMITERHFEPTTAGSDLTNLLVEFLDEILHEKYLYDVIPIMMHRLLGDNTTKIVGVRTPKFYNPIAVISFILGIWLLKFESRGFISKITSHYVNMKLLIGLEKYISEGEDTGIYIPPSLRKDWQLDNHLQSLFKKR